MSIIRDAEIKNELGTKRLDCLVLLPNSKFIENVGTIIRLSNAFLLKGVVVSEKTSSIRKQSCGTRKWEKVVVSKDPIEYALSLGYTIIGVQKHENSIKIDEVNCWPRKPAFVFGHETGGISEIDSNRCQFSVEIPMWGNVESFNVASAASIILWEYTKRTRNENSPFC